MHSIEIRQTGPTSGRLKNSITLELISSERLVAVTIWESGESEVITARIGSADDPSVSLAQLRTVNDVAELLTRVAMTMSEDEV
ncbi:hypothetical protein [Cellulomonas wangsupingiae]|uniref:Uncharacterized protein n=1 Tax=Cellulomonas wangsupingiae TaxID=2968085 RepID=A0ABY5K4Z2_9CELL|nr:hypothetical protein [Cellulomonas wangsupingiae]MCC2336641.1 hypothetical protein [Cellulomonas wangsupingiae]UUI64481.1 hypothetical protein NP075_15375 [Cellulomonas wangsupingiae]